MGRMRLNARHGLTHFCAQDSGKVYSLHEPKVECIAKGKAGGKYEFGNKVSLAVTSKGSWIVGTMS
jgi:IS5 family transposase